MRLSNKTKSSLISVGVWLLPACLLGLIVLFVPPIVNNDMYGRLSEIKTLGHGPASPADPKSLPTGRLVLHRIVSDENSIEASLILTIDRSLWESFLKEGETRLTLVVHDGSSFQPYALGGSVSLEAHPSEPGLAEISVQSDRFRLPTVPSVSGFPFDDIEIRALVFLRGSSGFVYPFDLEIQKALPGRLLGTSLDHGVAVITLSRSPTEKALVLTSSGVFLLICIVLAVKLFSTATTLKTLDHILALAGFLIAAGEFRNFLNIPTSSGTTSLEIAIIGVPLALLASLFAISTLRGMRKKAQ